MSKTTIKYMPQEVTAPEIVFGGDMNKLLPEWSAIPESFQDMNDRSDWARVVSDWFYKGLSSLDVKPKEGIDITKAIKHIKAILGSWKPKHEHKFAGCAYLMSLWFDEVKWTPAK